jgi:UDPglucose--hexose-1-phosphate uridylyltransferase
MLRRLDVARRYFDDTGRCVYDDVVAAERETRARIVAEVGRFAAFTPFASQSPFETWIAPTLHEPSFGNLADEDLPDFAELLVRVLAAIRRACGDPDYNLVVYSAPANEAVEAFLWHVRVLPKLSTPAGFELGSGMSINTMAPEDAAGSLREAMG